ncbi:hypothetical protein P3102_15790 [Amycolatopsis sp. QT-25]|uniref:hypothetical protein n=1 Tax=Amycolatopsis sp. QT-25 TaxID=3034022 RepID=UPI0023EAC216|nr:hypothetical protein [Amycolatopsis sp. QT-25]WET82559.1 hypothetical protein P3102_15790 [Amycolatopsis sp. QT-25]
MTTTPPELDAVRRDNTATVATLRAIPDVVGLLRSTTAVDPDNGETLGIVWDLWSHHIEDDQPMMRVGLRGEGLYLRLGRDTDAERVQRQLDNLDVAQKSVG